MQRSYVVNIDAGSFANVKIVVGGSHRGGGVWTPSSTATVTAKSKGHGHIYGTPRVFAVNRRFVLDGLIPSSPPLPSLPRRDDPTSANAYRSYPINIDKAHTALPVAIAVVAGTGTGVGVNGPLRI